MAYCPLKWVYDSQGSYPPYSVASTSNEYVARALYKAGEKLFYVPGRFEVSNKKAYIPYDGHEHEYTSYEVLTNPNNCVLNWVYACCGQVPQNAVGGENEIQDHGFVGREYKSRSLPGKVIPGTGLYVAYDSREHLNKEYEVLTSKGIEVIVSQINYKLPNSYGNNETVELIGKSVLINNASTTLRQKVTHRNSVSQSYSYTFSKFWSHTFGVKFSVSFPISVVNVSIEASHQYSEAYQNNKTLTGSTSSMVEISREVELPPFCSVTVTDTIKFVKNFPLHFEATGQFHGEGLSGSQVKDILGSSIDGEIIKITNDSVYAKIKGTFNGKWGLSIEENIRKNKNFKVFNKLIKFK